MKLRLAIVILREAVSVELECTIHIDIHNAHV